MAAISSEARLIARQVELRLARGPTLGGCSPGSQLRGPEPALPCRIATLSAGQPPDSSRLVSRSWRRRGRGRPLPSVAPAPNITPSLLHPSLQLLWCSATCGGPRGQEHQQRGHGGGCRGRSCCGFAGARCSCSGRVGWRGGAGSQACVYGDLCRTAGARAAGWSQPLPLLCDLSHVTPCSGALPAPTVQASCAVRQNFRRCRSAPMQQQHHETS
jgi:hypothetical protein